MSTGIVVSQVAVSQEKPVDREKTCPLLLRVFCANGRHNPVSEYSNRNGGSVPANELQMYTWLDCTLRELTSLIKEVNPDARRRGTTFDFAIISPDKLTPRYNSRDIGNTMNGQRGIDDSKTLHQCKFEIGDFVDVAITMPGAPRRFGGGNFGRDREFGGQRGDFGGPRGEFGGPRGDFERRRSPIRATGDRERERF